MIKAKETVRKNMRRKKVTSIGAHPTRSIPKNKHKRRCWKPYRGQGK